MLEDMIGRLVAGALWGTGAAAVLSLTRGGDGDGVRVRPLAKSLMKGYLVAVDRISELTAEARESLNDLYAEARAEREREEQEAQIVATAGKESEETERPQAVQVASGQ